MFIMRFCDVMNNKEDIMIGSQTYFEQRIYGKSHSFAKLIERIKLLNER